MVGIVLPVKLFRTEVRSAEKCCGICLDTYVEPHLVVLLLVLEYQNTVLEVSLYRDCLHDLPVLVHISLHALLFLRIDCEGSCESQCNYTE